MDGANILHAWPALWKLAKTDRETARTKLIQQLAVLHDAENVRVTVVFDGRGNDVVVERLHEQATFSIVYTSSALTADDVIERMVATAPDPAMCVVATDDAAERQTTAAAGAEPMSSADLEAWLKRADDRQVRLLGSRRSANNRVWRSP